MRRALVVAALAALMSAGAGAEELRASLLVMAPGRSYISSTGHAALRMENVERGFERCYSYESEPAGLLMARFLAGKLKMGMFRLPTEVFLKPYLEEQRGVTAYRLALPDDVMRELWRELDARADEGIELPYDYLKRGCAKAVLECLINAADRCGRRFSFPEDKPYFHLTCREAFGRSIPECPWTFIALHLIVGTDADAEGPMTSRIHTPADLLDLLKDATLDGDPVIADSGTELAPPGPPIKPPRVTPLECSLALLALTALAAVFPKKLVWLRWTVTAVLLTLSSLIGIVTIFAVFVSTAPGTTWNWLLPAFNPLPAIFWRYRRRWAIPAAFALVAWLAGMIFSPKMLVDVPYIILGAALILLFLSASRHR